MNLELHGIHGAQSSRVCNNTNTAVKAACPIHHPSGSSGWLNGDHCCFLRQQQWSEWKPRVRTTPTSAVMSEIRSRKIHVRVRNFALRFSACVKSYPYVGGQAMYAVTHCGANAIGDDRRCADASVVPTQ